MTCFAANGVLLTDAQLFVYQYIKCAYLLSVILEPALVIPQWEQDLVFHFVELYEIPIDSFLQSLEVSRNGWCINHPSQFHTVCELAEATLGPITQAINAKQGWTLLLDARVTGLKLAWLTAL